MLSIVNQTY